MTYLSLEDLASFKAQPRYNHGLDALCYRIEGGTCVAERLGKYLTILWNRERTRLVGIELKGFRYIFNRIKDQFGWSDADFVPLVSILEAIVADGEGDRILAEQQEKYELAKQCVRNIHLTRDDLRQMAA